MTSVTFHDLNVFVPAGGPGKFISLQFVSMKTECSYDYLFVYDGQSYSAPLLASFSGNTLPDRVIASSGHVSHCVHGLVSPRCVDIVTDCHNVSNLIMSI